MSTSYAKHLEERYGQPIQLNPQALNDSIAAQLSHRSVRNYLDKPLPEGTLEVLVAAAQSAATSSNLQAWSVVAIENQQTKDQLSAIGRNQAHIRQAPLFLVWVADFSRAKRVAAARGVELETLDYLETVLLGGLDATLAAQNAVVALESLGLSSVYIGGIRNDIAAVIRLLKLPPHSYPVFGLCVGYADPASPAEVKPRLPQQVVLHRESYSSDNEAKHIEEYDSRLEHFYRQQGLPPSDWSTLAVERLKSTNSLHGRDKLAGILKDQGFSLK